jgi:hypothetical protein
MKNNKGTWENQPAVRILRRGRGGEEREESMGMEMPTFTNAGGGGNQIEEGSHGSSRVEVRTKVIAARGAHLSSKLRSVGKTSARSGEVGSTHQ